MNAAQHISGVSNMIADSKSRLDGDRFDWMLACNVFLKINQILSPVEVDLFASRLTHQLPQFFRPTGRGNGCFPTRLKQGEGLCQSPLVSDRPCPQQNQGPTGSGDPDSPSLEESAPVWKSQPSNLGDADELPSTHSSLFTEGAEPQGIDITPQLAVWPVSGRIPNCQPFNRSFRPHAGLLEDKSLQTGVLRGIMIPFHNFLTHLHKEGYQSRSLNAYRSAISSVHDTVDGMEVGKHPVISRLLKGAFLPYRDFTQFPLMF